MPRYAVYGRWEKPGRYWRVLAIVRASCPMMAKSIYCQDHRPEKGYSIVYDSIVVTQIGEADLFETQCELRRARTERDALEHEVSRLAPIVQDVAVLYHSREALKAKVADLERLVFLCVEEIRHNMTGAGSEIYLFWDDELVVAQYDDEVPDCEKHPRAITNIYKPDFTPTERQLVDAARAGREAEA